MAMRRVMPLHSHAYSDFRPGWIIIPARHDDNEPHWPGGITQQLVYVYHHCQRNLGNQRRFALKLLLLGRSKKKFLTTPKHQSMSGNANVYAPQLQLSRLAKHSNQMLNHARKTSKACSSRVIWKL
jgi:hypothetical protein